MGRHTLAEQLSLVTLFAQCLSGELMRKLAANISFGHSCQKKTLVAKYCARLTYESHTHTISTILNQVLSTCFLKSLYSNIASYKQTQQTIASSQWWVTSVTPLNQNILDFCSFDFFAFLKDRWSSGDLLTQRHQPCCRPDPNGAARHFFNPGTKAAVTRALRRSQSDASFFASESSTLRPPRHRWSPLIMVEHGWSWLAGQSNIIK